MNTDDEYDIVAEAESILREDGIETFSVEELLLAGRQVIDRINRPITEEEIRIIASEINDLRVSAIMLRAWETGKIFMAGIKDGEVIWAAE